VPLFAAAASVLGFTALGGTGLASAAPAAQATASPSPEPSKKPSVFSMKIDTYTSATNQQFVGPGISPPEAATFAQGGVQAPISPYALFSGAPLVTGQGTAQDFLLTPTFAVNPHIDAAVTIGYGSASGTGNVINYWGDPIMPSINPNLGVKAFTLAPAFPTHNGADAASATRLGFLSASVTEHSGLGSRSAGSVRIKSYRLRSRRRRVRTRRSNRCRNLRTTSATERRPSTCSKRRRRSCRSRASTCG
jgi:hypothetical protein